MYPAVSILGLHLTVHDVFVQLAVIVAVVFGPAWSARLTGLPAARMRRAFLVLALVALAGGRAHFLVNSAASFVRHPLAAFDLTRGPFHVPGAMIALLLALPWVCRRYGLPLATFADGGVPAVGVALAIARLGCFLQGCCFGRACDGFWCMAFPEGSGVFVAHAQAGRLPPGATESLPVHPLQLYFLGAALLGVLTSLALYRTRRFDGEITLVSLVMISASTLALEHMRADEIVRVYWGPLPQLTWTALAMTVVSVAALLGAETAHSRRRFGARQGHRSVVSMP